MDTRDYIKDMLTSLINNDEAGAAAAVHHCLVAKSQEIAKQPSDSLENSDDE